MYGTPGHRGLYRGCAGAAQHALGCLASYQGWDCQAAALGSVLQPRQQLARAVLNWQLEVKADAQDWLPLLQAES